MLIRQATILALTAAVLAGCESSTSPSASLLQGRWATTRDALSPAGSHQGFLTFAGRAFVFEARSFGLYGGQSANDLSAYSRTEGTFRVEGDRVHFSPTRLVTWDRFYGVDSPPLVESPYPGSLFDNARFTLRFTTLALHYVIYPADAPVETSRIYRRQ